MPSINLKGLERWVFLVTLACCRAVVINELHLYPFIGYFILALVHIIGLQNLPSNLAH